MQPGRGPEVRPREQLGVVCLFAILVVLMTYPIALRLSDATRDGGDPLLNAWIMWWDYHAVTSGNLAGFFDANIFFPHRTTLAYSEFLLVQSLIGAPVLAMSDNPVLAHNVVGLLAMVTTGWAAYLLGRYLAGDLLAGLVAGIAMAFSPFMFDHLSHVQVLSAAGLPGGLLLLHRYFDEGAERFLLGFTVVWLVQALANGYYAIYLTYLAGAYILFRAATDRRLADARLWRRLILHLAPAAALLAPLFLHYVRLRNELGFTREMGFAAAWYSFFATSSINRLYGDVTAPLWLPEGALFPCATLMILAAYGIGSGARRSGPGESPADRVRSAAYLPAASADPENDETCASRAAPIVARAVPLAARAAYPALGAMAFVGLFSLVAITVTGGFTIVISGLRVSGHSLLNPLLALVGGIIGRRLLRRRYPSLRELFRLDKPVRFYATMLLATALLSLGEQGPYRILFDLAPGFDGLRAVARIHVVSLLCLSVLAAIGVERIRRTKLAPRGLAAVAWILPLLLLAEQFSAPVPLHAVAWERPPEVYRWLAERPGGYAVIEFPIEYALEFDRMLYSTIHEKPLVNGVSGYPAPVHTEIAIRSRPFPSDGLVRDLEAIGVRWIVVHRNRYGDRWPQVAQRLARYPTRMKPVAELGDVLVLETRPETWRTSRLPPPERHDPIGTLLPRSGWKATASVNPELAALALDGDHATRWRSEPQAPNDRFAVDLGAIRSFDRIELVLDRFPHDYPRGWLVEVSADGRRWSVVSRQSRFRPPIEQFLAARGLRVSIDVPRTSARHVRITQTGRDPTYVWSIHEFELRRDVYP